MLIEVLGKDFGNTETAALASPVCDSSVIHLADRDARVNVFTFGNPPVKTADRVEVHGVFKRVNRVGRYTFHDEIVASSVLPAH
jgi:hypothetical protein